MSLLLASLRDPARAITGDSYGGPYTPAQLKESSLSQSLLCGLRVLSCFPPDSSYLGVGDVARMLGMSPSTTHRYLSTLVVAGLLERDPTTRTYRIPPVQ